MQLLPVYLNGDRDYVQGIQLIFMSVDGLLSTWQKAEAVLKEVSFTKITTNLAYAEISSEPADVSGRSLIGKLKLESSEEKSDIIIHLYESPDIAPQKISSPELYLDRIDQYGDRTQNGTFFFSGISNFAESLNMIVQAIKKLHSDSDPDMYDIWFTGVRKGNIPINQSPVDGFIEIQHVRNNGSKGVYQSLQKVTIMDSNKKTVGQAVILFAYKKMGTG